ncbi:hypothetical protein [Acinetobacter johnsonii]|uniref:hypothetical protein n=1 Tax=Acinetobacter johnsonii TaxID=40214 RepID=UPI001F2C73C1|nr:hypothetical protein [Acinetobacter johnsonii]
MEDFLSKFEAYSKQVPQENFESYLYAMLDSADGINSESNQFFGFSSQTYLFRLSFWCLENIQDKKERATLLKKYINLNSNFSFINYFLFKEQKNREENQEILLDDSDFQALKNDFIVQLNRFANSCPDKLIQHHSFLSLMYCWKEWENSSIVLTWFETQTQNIEGILKVLQSMILVTRSSNDFYTISNIKKYIKADTVENFLDITRILNIIDSTNTSILSDEEKELIEMLRKGIENKANN